MTDQTENHISPFQPINIIPVKPESLFHVTKDEDYASYALPPDWKIEHVDIESKLLYPRRAKGHVIFDSLDSFCQYFEMYSLGDGTIWAGVNPAHKANRGIMLRAVLNDHLNAKGGDVIIPGWRDFIADYAPEFSDSFNVWKANDQKPLTQEQFAALIEDNIHDIYGLNTGGKEGLLLPSGADMLNMALKMEINHKAEYKSLIRLESGGVELAYTDGPDSESIRKMQAFNQFVINIPIYEGRQPDLIDVRLRYKLQQGKLTFAYKMIGLRQRIDQSNAEIIREVEIKIGEKLYLGNPNI